MQVAARFGNASTAEQSVDPSSLNSIALNWNLTDANDSEVGISPSVSVNIAYWRSLQLNACFVSLNLTVGSIAYAQYRSYCIWLERECSFTLIANSSR